MSTTAAPATTIEEHAPNTMTVDERVQRALSEARVGQLMADLRLSEIGLPILSRRANDTLAILDGQHRIAALKRSGHGDTAIRCEVYDDLTAPQEAAVFLARNNRYLVNIIDRFRIGVQSDDAECVKIDNIIVHHGFRVAMGENALLCIGTVQQLYRGGKSARNQCHPEVLDATLRIISEAWGTDNTAIKETVAGVGLVNKLARLSGGPAGLAGRAKTLRQIGKATTISDGAAQAVVDLYNEGLRKTGRLGDPA